MLINKSLLLKSYIVEKKNHALNLNDSFIYLYSPVIGNNATSLYNFLVVESNQKSGNFLPILRIMEYLNFNEKIFFNSFQKLISLNLIKLFEETVNSNKVKFIILSPMSSESFFANTQLKSILKLKIGIENYGITKVHFNISHNDKFTEVTSEIPLDENLKYENSFNLSPLKEFISKQIDISIFWNKEFERFVTNLIVNDRNIYDIAEAILEVSNNNVVPTIENVTFKLDNTIADIIQEDPKIQKMEVLKKINPSLFIKESLGRSPTSDEITFINSLLTNEFFTIQMINLLLDFSILKNKGAIVIPYLLKVSKTLITLQINNAADLVKYLQTSVKIGKNINLEVPIFVEDKSMVENKTNRKFEGFDFD